jgi:glutamate synthase domain-containing protein 2/glutamate synthase domain-containing protein 1/glutamate synthase domain-containing protein 3
MHQSQIAAANGQQRYLFSLGEGCTSNERPDYPLYDPAFEHDACGTGFVANVSGARDHLILECALEALANLAHRGAMDADAETSDGAGVMTHLPYRLLAAWLVKQGLSPVVEPDLAVGMLFLPRPAEAAACARHIMHDALAQRGAHVLGWREVPVNPEALGSAARRTCPRIEQVLAQRPHGMTLDAFERLLYLARKETESRLATSGITGAYIASLSARTIVYKGLLTAKNLPCFYLDLKDPCFSTAFALFHQRYSTNTFPSWPLAQPMRMLAHNGEINTVQGNRNWMAAREIAHRNELTTIAGRASDEREAIGAGESADATAETLFARHWGQEARWLRPVIQPGGSDSASLDNALELLERSGRDLLHALTLLVPEAWEGREDRDPAVRAFFQAQAPLLEPWDGPAALVFSDGRLVGAALDRNGLRPLRYVVTADGVMVLASEVGVVALDEAQIIAKGRLGPGQVLAVDTARGLLLHDDEIKAELAARQPYATWVRDHLVPVALRTGNDEADHARLALLQAEEERKAGVHPHDLGDNRDSWSLGSVPDDLPERQALFGYSHEDVEFVLRPMVGEGVEPVWSMGDDTPLSVLSQQPRPLAMYFKQRFAQVTNPPIDSLREQFVMSLTTYLGSRGDLLADAEPTGALLQLPSPLLDEQQLAAVHITAQKHLGVARLATVYQNTSLPPSAENSNPGENGDSGLSGGDAGLSGGDLSAQCGDPGPKGPGHGAIARAGADGALRQALDDLEARAVAAVRAGAGLLLLSDREVPAGAMPLPMPLALAATHQALVCAGLRLRVGLVVETGAVWDVHQVALLIGYGANAVCPYLALATVRSLAGTRGLEDVTPIVAEQRYRAAIEKGLLKVMARMGLSVIESYLGAQLFECIGIDPSLVDRYFPGTPNLPGGLTLAVLDRLACAQRADAERLAALRDSASGRGGPEHERSVAQGSLGQPDRVLALKGQDRSTHAPALEGREPMSGARLRLADRGYVRFRRNAEYHAANPQVVRALQQAVRSGERADYQRYTDLVYSRPPMAIRDRLTFRPGELIPLDEVEPAEVIVRRFVSSAMSLGALSPEAHLALTLGANRLGARSNTGEGGEDPAWYRGTRDGVSTNSRVKQVASARFGVTTVYLAHAEELEIKMAQGSKPGEGGQLPARKVTGLIARLRHTTTGIPLISPPPHHDIYSIEDLAQLIYDLKQVNPRVAVGVKLVAERGVGTVAAGVAKAHADYILISGHDGGTGASPLSAIKCVGSPWELGLAEAQQVLRLNGLRGRVRLRTDGGLKTGRDIVVAALLGADEFGFGTAALMAIGCDMARQCHLDTCPTGIATQREDLRQRFTGRPEHLISFFLALAEEVRELLAMLGARTLDEIIGRTDLLLPKVEADGARWLDLAPLLVAGDDETPRRYMLARACPSSVADPSSHPAASSGDAGSMNGAGHIAIHNELLPEPQLLDAAAPLLERGYGVLLHQQIRNGDRTVSAGLAGEIARRWGDGGLPRGSITCHFTGSAGQSFGAFCVPGLRLILVGDANDYVAKSMSGGEIIVMPPLHRRFVAHEQVIAGNTILYGATGGVLLMQGQAGERFAVRNSGAIAVVEGVGDHGCEYMTGGVVVVLGPTGRNFGAGMSGGIAYVYDEEQRLPGRLNSQMVGLERMTDAGEINDLAALIRYHAQVTSSDRAAGLLDQWPIAASHFWRVTPNGGVSAAQPLAPYMSSLRPAAGMFAYTMARQGGADAELTG